MVRIIFKKFWGFSTICLIWILGAEIVCWFSLISNVSCSELSTTNPFVLLSYRQQSTMLVAVWESSGPYRDCHPQETLYLLLLALEYWHFEHILYDICRIIVDFHFVQMLIVILCPLLLSIMCNNSLMRNIAGMYLICWSSRTENCYHFILHFCNVRKRSL